MVEEKENVVGEKEAQREIRRRAWQQCGVVGKLDGSLPGYTGWICIS